MHKGKMVAAFFITIHKYHEIVHMSPILSRSTWTFGCWNPSRRNPILSWSWKPSRWKRSFAISVFMSVSLPRTLMYSQEVRRNVIKPRAVWVSPIRATLLKVSNCQGSCTRRSWDIVLVVNWFDSKEPWLGHSNKKPKTIYNDTSNLQRHEQLTDFLRTKWLRSFSRSKTKAVTFLSP